MSKVKLAMNYSKEIQFKQPKNGTSFKLCLIAKLPSVLPTNDPYELLFTMGELMIAVQHMPGKRLLDKLHQYYYCIDTLIQKLDDFNEYLVELRKAPKKKHRIYRNKSNLVKPRKNYHNEIVMCHYGDIVHYLNANEKNRSSGKKGIIKIIGQNTIFTMRLDDECINETIDILTTTIKELYKYLKEIEKHPQFVAII